MGARVGRSIPRKGGPALANALKAGGRSRKKGAGRGRRLPDEAPPTFEARVFPDIDDLASAGAEQFRDAAAEAIAASGVFRVALAGGSTPRSVHARLTAAPMRDAIEWGKILFFFGDERCVAPDSDRSNYRMAKETLFDPLGIPPGRVLRIRGEEDPKRAASEYAAAFRAQFEDEGGVPRFDLVLLGLGPDGHTASLFPHTRALQVVRDPVAANWVPKLSEWRVTLTLPALNAARRVVFLVAGAEKTAPATAILKRSRGYRVYPAALVRPRRGSLLWLLDEEAGGRI